MPWMRMTEKTMRVHHGSIVARIICGLCLTVLGSLLLPMHMPAARAVAAPLGIMSTLTVTTTADEVNSDGDCSLREAIQAANTNTAVDACAAGSGADTIHLPAGTYTMSVAGSNEDANATGDLDVHEDVTIKGAGPAHTVLNGAGQDRVLHGLSGALTVQDLTIEDGVVQGAGGAIQSNGKLTITDVTFRANRSSFRGGAVQAADTVTIADSFFIQNVGGDRGGALHTATDATISTTQFLNNILYGGEGGGALVSGNAVISKTIFRGNRSPGGGFPSGGGLTVFGNLTMADSQFIDNSTVYQGGAMSINGQATVVNSVFGRNTAPHGAAIFVGGSSQIIHSTIAYPTFDNHPAIVIAGGTLGITNTIVTSYTLGVQPLDQASVIEDYNLFFGNTTNLTGTVTSGGHSIVGAPNFHAPLCDVYKLGTGSAAINAGTDVALRTDFEGDARPRLGNVDQGYDEATSFVIEVPIWCISATNSSPTTLGQPTTLAAQILGGTNVSYTWNFGDGSATASGAQVTHTYGATGLFTATVTATNPISTAVTTTQVRILNQAPIASAGADQMVPAGSTVTLNGSLSMDPDGHTPLHYQWVQTSGPAVTLSDPAAMNPVFTAPTTGTMLTFNLIIMDSFGLASVSPDSVTIIVQPGTSPTIRRLYLPILIATP